ncbi:hypothetical protein ACLOJK_028596 [Asimina triloba]
MSSGLLKSVVCTVGLVVFVGLLLLLLVDSVENEGANMAAVKSATTTSSASATTRGSFMDSEDVVGRRRLHDHDPMNLNYMSKRKVPNGPDPIHNRY